MRVYIAGPISGRPNGNRPLFAEVAEFLAGQGYTPVNPHDVDPHAHAGDCPAGLPGGEGSEHTAPCYMRTDLAALLTCDAMWLLPGWHRSEGARLEYLVGHHVCKMPILNVVAAFAFGVPEVPDTVAHAFPEVAHLRAKQDALHRSVLGEALVSTPPTEGEPHWLVAHDPKDGEPFGEVCRCAFGADHR